MARTANQAIYAVFERFVTTRTHYEWTDVQEEVRKVANVKNWMTVRNIMVTVNHRHNWMRDYSDITGPERYVPRTAEATATELKLRAELAQYISAEMIR